MYSRYLKTVLDRILAFVALAALSPVILAAGIAIKMETRGPAFFRQERLGKDGRVFTIFKLRTMVQGAAGRGAGIFTYRGDPRITRVGAFLRKTSLDEIPQVINVLRGEMSFIGPRPVLIRFPKEYGAYTAAEKIRFSVRPGISGLAQLECRAFSHWKETFSFDARYIETLSFKNDLTLFMRSLTVFFKTDDVYSGAYLELAKKEERKNRLRRRPGKK